MDVQEGVKNDNPIYSEEMQKTADAFGKQYVNYSHVSVTESCIKAAEWTKDHMEDFNVYSLLQN